MDWEVRAASLILCLGILLATIQDGIAERRIVCYYTNWSVYRPGTAKFSPQNINPYLCTHLIYAFGGFTKENALRPFDKYQDIEKGGYAKFTGLKTYNKNLKTMLAIGGWNEGSSRFSPMVADSARRREFVKNAIKFLRQNHFDGLDLDWEYPAFRDGGKPRDKDNYANLVQELREEFERESSKTGRPRLLLSMAMPAGIEYIDKGYDVPRLNEYLDFINLLSYDYHSAYEPAVNHHSPLYPLEEDNEYNYDAELTIDYTISHLLEKGASADKVVLGIPTYGRSYTLFNQDATELGSPADGPGTEGEATREKGYLAYYEICEGIAESDDWEVVKPNPKAMGPYAFKGNQWVGYDDENIVRLKARYVNEKKLGGIMFWSIDNDDFRGKCHGRPYPLIEAAKEALLADNRNTIDKTKSVDNRKKTRTQSNTRKSNTSSRRSSTTSSPIISKRVSSSRPKYRTVSQSKSEEQDDREVSRRSYDPSSEEDTEGRNTVTVTEKIERPKNRNRSKTRGASADRSTRRKQSRRKGQSKTDESGESLSNKLTTPEPPTTPDPGTDFKCEDEGFFPHPRDCKKYFWCLDSGPSGLGVVAHQFTCPSGLVFNKAADSCDYPRNVICPKTSKTSIVSTTRSPITAATSRTTYLHSTTTAKAESEEFDSEEEYDDDDEIAESEEEEEEEEEEVKEEPKTTTTTTTKPLIYKTLTRNRPSTTTTTRTTLKSNEPEKVIDNEDEEDPKVIKELIDLIKKAGGIEELEKQLLLQEKNSNTKSGSESETPATISRSLYERVLNRQANRIGNQRPAFSSSETSYVNGPGRAQFEGLDDIPEVKSLRRSQKPQYVTIERSKSVTKESENEGIDENEEDDDSTDVASSEEKSISNPEGSSSTQRVTPSYVNIRRTRLSTTTSRTENDVEGKKVEIEEKRSTRRRRPFVSSKQQDNEASSEIIKPSRNRGLSFSFRNSEKRDDDLKSTDLSAEKDDDSSTTKSRYTNVQRFRSTTLKTSEDASSVVPLSEVINEPTLSMGIEEYPEFSSTSLPSSTPASTSTSTEVITVISVEPPENSPSVSPKNTVGSTTDSVKLVEDSATEILFTTLPAASSSSQSTTTTTTTTTTLASRSTIATVSQPRPFGFTRRKSGSSEATTTATTPLSRSKVSISSRNPTRPSSPALGRVRLRTRPANRIAEEDSVDQVETPRAETFTSRSKDVSRARNRGASRYISPTSKSRTEDVSANSVSGPRYRERGRTTTSTTASTITSSGLRRRYRRPGRVNSTESIKANELNDSPIVRITQGGSRNKPSLQSRSDSSEEENGRITNIRVFRKPTVNRELYDRTKYTRKRNNVQEPVQKANDDSNQKQTTSITFKVPRADAIAEYKIERNDLLNNVDQSTATIDSVVESNTIQSIYTNDATTASTNKIDYTSDRPEDAVVTTTAHIEAYEFNPDLVTIVSTERVVDVTEGTSETPKRRKIILRKRPISSSTAANIIETEEKEISQIPRRRKVIKRKRPLQDTSSTSAEVSFEEEENSSLSLESTTPMGSSKKIEKSTNATDRTRIIPMTKNAEESTIAAGLTEFTREMEDSTITETTLFTDNSDGSTKVTLETPATEITTIPDDEATSILSTTISTINTNADEDQSTIETGTESTTMELMLATATSYNTESNTFSEETLIPSTKPENLSTNRAQITTMSPMSDTDLAITRSQATTTPFTTESDSSLATKLNFDSRYARKKFVRKSLATSTENTTNRYSTSLSSTENNNLDISSRRRNNLFIRRHPGTTNALQDDLKYKKEEGEENIEGGSHDVNEQEITEDTTLRSKSVSTNGLSDSSVEFWKQYATASRDQINHPSEDNTYQSTSTATRGPETRSRYKVPIILKRPFDPEEALSPRRHLPLDSAPEESEETPETRESRLKQSGFRQPRTRYKLRDRDNVKVNEDTTSPSPESTSTWQYFRTRTYPKRTSSTSTEAAATETLIPAKKFDYVADAFHRKQQSLRTTTTITPRSNDLLDSQNLIDPYYARITTVPSVTRLVTSVTESGTTERQKILIKTKYSSLTSTTRIPADQFPPTSPSSVSVTGIDDDESVNEIRQGVERSTLPIESEFNYRYGGRVTTESHESSTIEIESVFSNLIAGKSSANALPCSDFQVADSETIRLPTLKELIGYPTTYYDDHIATTSASVLLHLPRNDVDNDISRQNVDESLRRIDESQDDEKELASYKEATSFSHECYSRKRGQTKEVFEFDLFLKPTTMRGIPLASLTPSPIMRGFYITKGEDVLPSSIFTTITTTESSVQQQTETTVPDIFTTDEIVTHNDQSELGPNIPDNSANNIISDKSEGRFFTFTSSVDSLEEYPSNTENILNQEKFDLNTVDRSASKRGKSVRNFDHNTTPSFNSYVVSPTSPTRRRIALVVNRYNEASTPLWTGRRIVRKRNKTTIVSPIKDAIRRTENDSIRTTNSLNDYLTSKSILSPRGRKFPITSTTPTIPLIASDSTSPEIANSPNNLANSNDIEDLESHATVELTMTLTNSVVTATPSISEIISTTNKPTIADISTFSDDPTTTPTIATVITTTPLIMAIAKAPTVATDATITTTTANTETETTSLNYLTTDHPTIENTNAIPTDFETTTTFAANTETEIVSANPAVPPITRTISTDSTNTATPNADNIESETTSMTSYSTITIPTTADTQEVATDSENMTTDQVANADISTIFTIANYSTIPTTTNTYDVITDSTISIEPPNIELETTSTIGNYSTLTTTGVNNTRATTTIPATATALLTTIISSTVNAPVHITAPVTTNNLADADTVTANEITTNTPLNIITPTNADLNEVTTSANANIFSTSAIGDILPITNRSTTNSIILSEVPNTSTDVTSMSSIISTLTTESSTIDLANPSTFNISNNSEILTVTSEFTQTTEIPTTFETTSKSISTTITLPKSLPSTNFETLSTATAALSPEEDENSSMSMITQNSSTLLSITTPITSKTNIVSERSVTSATSDESIATNSMIYTTSAYKPDLIQMINEESTISEQEIDFKKGMSVETQSQSKDQTTTIINKPSIAQTTSEENTTPKMKVVSEETISKFTESQKQNRTTSEYDTINYQYNKKASRRRVVNRTNNWLGSPVTLQRTNEYPRHRVAVHRRRRPSTDISSSTENNHRRRIMRKRVRVNSEAINSTIRSHQDIVDIQNITEDQVVHNRAENVRKRMKTELNEIKEKIGEEVTTMLSTEKTTVFPQPSAIIENEHIEKKRKIIVKKLKQSQENSTTEESSTNPYFTNENPSNNSKNNLHVNKNLLQQEKPRKIIRVVLKNVKLKSEKQKLIEEASADSDSIDKNMQDNFSKSLYANNDLSDKEIVRRMRVVLKNSPISEEKNSTISKTNVDSNKNLHDNFSNNLNISQAPSNKEKIKRRMRVVLKSVKPKSEERNSTIEEINEDSDLTNKNLQNNLSNNFNTSQIFSNEDKTRRRMRVVKRVKPKSKETGIKTEEASVEHDSTNESLQGAFSNNLRNSKNLLDYGTRRRMRVVLKSIKSKSEGNITVEEVRIDSNFTNGDTFSNNSRSGKDLPLKYGSRRRTRVVLKSVRPKSEKRNSTVEEASVDSDSIDKDLQGSFSSNFHIKKNFPDKEQTRRRTGVIPRSIAAKSEEKDSIAEETNIELEYERVREQPQLFSTFNFSNNLYGSNNFPEKEKTMTPSKSGEEETTIKQLGVTEPRITGTSVLVEEDTDRPSLEVTTSTSIGRKSGSGTRHRKPAQFTTVAPLTNTLSNTERTSRRGRPALETTLSSRIDHVDAFEGDEAYVKPTAVLHDQNADVSSDQSVRAQEFAVTLSEPPSSSSDIGRTPLRNEDRRKISTTIAPRTDSTTSKTVSRYGADFRSRQRPRTKERPTINATARPRRPPVIDYDYYEDEVPIVVGKSVLNSKLFLTSKGTIRCLDQGNFPHPYSCKKFITCARMVNGQVIGTEYTCPDKLSFDPVGGICNWSAGLGCKDQ
ncbi:uncharacterized protein LOC105426278 [Pogonomyrmex barbatus]|uniref:chitinase n=1 Tax=Pogonomyrmex barbatus TaxID=144034 RepID=A0A8N1S4U5_9HYME|nr:uncharacterized protein LOC105426278 [Pogonomyrmex barbatus]